jgi:hypothetical protein
MGLLSFSRGRDNKEEESSLSIRAVVLKVLPRSHYMSPSTLHPLKPQSQPKHSTTLTFFLFLCTYLILSPNGVVSAAPIAPLAVVPPASSSLVTSSSIRRKSKSNAKKNSSRPPQQYPEPQHPQKTTMYGSDEQPAIENHEAAVVSSKQQLQQEQQSTVAVTGDTSITDAAVNAQQQQQQQQQQPQPEQQQPYVSHRDPIYMWSSLAAGVGSGALASLICAPLDLVRTRMQVWGQVVRSSAANAAAAQGGSAAKQAAAGAAASAQKALSLTGMLRDIVQRDGWRGCFRGLSATLVTVPTFWGVYCKFDV